jgi:hypothetical protein
MSQLDTDGSPSLALGGAAQSEVKGTATHFHYRAELMERRADFWGMFFLLRTHYFYTVPLVLGRWLFSWLLGTFAGYGDYFGQTGSGDCR